MPDQYDVSKTFGPEPAVPGAAYPHPLNPEERVRRAFGEPTYEQALEQRQRNLEGMGQYMAQQKEARRGSNRSFLYIILPFKNDINNRGSNRSFPGSVWERFYATKPNRNHHMVNVNGLKGLGA